MSSMSGVNVPDEENEGSSNTEEMDQYLDQLKQQLDELIDDKTKDRIEKSQELYKTGSHWIELLTSKPFQKQKDEVFQVRSIPNTSLQSAMLTHDLQLRTNTFDAKNKMRALIKGLFGMVLDMAIFDINHIFHRDLGRLPHGDLHFTDNEGQDEDMVGADQEQIEEQRELKEHQRALKEYQRMSACLEQHIRNRQAVFDRLAQDMLSHAMTGMETRLEQLEDAAEKRQVLEGDSSGSGNGMWKNKDVDASKT